jgi:hypothetical protein
MHFPRSEGKPSWERERWCHARVLLARQERSYSGLTALLPGLPVVLH